jgi:hypothetical protein
MNKPKFTPGPWRVVENNGGGAFVETSSVAIADIKSRGGVPHPEQEHCMANAKLISAGPELFEALRAHLAWYDGATVNEKALIAYTRAALKKALGET